jgi:hypothetical protein
MPLWESGICAKISGDEITAGEDNKMQAIILAAGMGKRL